MPDIKRYDENTVILICSYCSFKAHSRYPQSLEDKHGIPTAFYCRWCNIQYVLEGNEYFPLCPTRLDLLFLN